MPGRNAAQCRTHGQKHFKKLEELLAITRKYSSCKDISLTEKESKKVKDYDKVASTIINEMDDRSKMRGSNGKPLVI